MIIALCYLGASLKLEEAGLGSFYQLLDQPTNDALEPMYELVSLNPEFIKKLASGEINLSRYGLIHWTQPFGGRRR